jgi:hypothetical protein
VEAGERVFAAYSLNSRGTCSHRTGRQAFLRAAAQNTNSDEAIIQQPVGHLPRGSNLLILRKLKTPAARLWDARKTIEHGWSRTILTVQIETKLHESSGKATANFGYPTWRARR